MTAHPIGGADRSDPAADVPEWFARALAAPVQVNSVTVDGVPIAYRTWGPPGVEGVVLVHGGSAHSRWWDHIAPLLSEGRRVVALDLSGHGDSGRRAAYTLSTWAHEVMCVAADAGLAESPVLVGHSMGGYVVLQAALDFGDDLGGVVVVDSPVHAVSPEEHEALKRRAFGPLRVYDSRATAISRFRLVPDQDVTLDFVMGHIVATSLAEHAQGWTWKFDPLIFRDPFLKLGTLIRLTCRVALLRAENGRLTAAMSATVCDTIGPALEVEIPSAGHHPMLDQPLALVTGLRTVLSSWQPSDTRRPPPDPAPTLL